MSHLKQYIVTQISNAMLNAKAWSFDDPAYSSYI